METESLICLGADGPERRQASKPEKERGLSLLVLGHTGTNKEGFFMDLMTAMSGPAAFDLVARLAGLGVVTVGAQGGGLGLMLARCVGCGAAMAGAHSSNKAGIPCP